MSLFGLDKLQRLLRIIKQNNGIIKTLYKVWRFDCWKEGMYMGMDEFGNKFYQNNYYMLGRNRWVEYADNVKFNYDASQITPEWYGWLHYKTDLTPCEDPAKRELWECGWCAAWLKPHLENQSNTPCAYYPYSTTRPAVSVWRGDSKEKKR